MILSFCALRSQEEYANSLYNQLVKNCYGIDYSYSLFLQKIKFILDYKTYTFMGKIFWQIKL